jgi:hypothetical protein
LLHQKQFKAIILLPAHGKILALAIGSRYIPTMVPLIKEQSMSLSQYVRLKGTQSKRK